VQGHVDLPERTGAGARHRIATRSMNESFLLQVAEISAGLVGLFLVGVFFYVGSELRQTLAGDGELDAYMRVGTRIVLIMYAIPLGVPLALVGVGAGWARWLFLGLSIVLVAANVDTVVRIGAVARETRSFALVANEAVSTALVVAVVVLPWALGGWRPTAEDLTPSLLLALGGGFLSTFALIMALFDLRRGIPTR
jgi:hypothetical protein